MAGEMCRFLCAPAEQGKDLKMRILSFLCWHQQQFEPTVKPFPRAQQRMLLCPVLVQVTEVWAVDLRIPSLMNSIDTRMGTCGSIWFFSLFASDCTQVH